MPFQASAASGVAADQIVLSLDDLSAAITTAQPRFPVCAVTAENRISPRENGQLPVSVSDQVWRIYRSALTFANDAATAFQAFGTNEVCLKNGNLIPTFADAVSATCFPAVLLNAGFRLRDNGEHSDYLPSKINRRLFGESGTSAALAIAAHEIVVAGELLASTVASAVEHPYPVPAGIQDRLLFRYDREHTETLPNQISVH